MKLELHTGGLIATIDEATAGLTLWEAAPLQRLLVVPDLALFRPVLGGEPVAARLAGAHLARAEGTDEIVLRFDAACCADYTVHLRAAGTHFELYATFTAVAATELNRLELIPARSIVNMYDVVNFRNRHHTAATWPELNLGGSGCETDTYSRDWQFAPHPTMMVLRKARTHLLFGALDRPAAFGMYLKVAAYRVEHCFLDFGAPGSGLALEAGARFTSPRFCLLRTRDLDVHQTMEAYTALQIEQGIVPDPAARARFAWHTEPLYCTWVDQIARAHAPMEAELAAQGETMGNAYHAIDEKLVGEALGVMARERLPFRTILLDEGWEVTRGQWEPAPERFPDLRCVVDQIHALGMKVVVWWNWAEINDDAEVDEAHLMAGGRRNRHGRRVRDYSNPATQREYLEPLFEKLFSAAPGCYDLDGVKTDFLADKVHPEMPVHDPAWRGEENYFYRVSELFFAAMRRHKPDACHIGCAGNPHLAQFIDINRTYDVWGSNALEHHTRGQMLRATTPGCPVAFDFHNPVENMDAYFELAQLYGYSVQIGNILYQQPDPFTAWEAAETSLYEVLRRGLGTG